MTFSEDAIKAAHKHSSRHRRELIKSDECGCFYCGSVFALNEVRDWLSGVVDDLDEEDTALCPRCGIDSVIGDNSGYPVANSKFLAAMRAYWF